MTAISKMPGMLLIGAASRKAGKTLLATRLIRKHKAEHPIVGAKVTTIHEEVGPCPRGEEGCGVCSSLEGPFRLTKELGDLEGKDTTRLLEAGASPVWWLCVRQTDLAAGAQALTARIGSNTVSLCESNSLRRVVEPGLFVIVQRVGQASVKQSCRQVWDLADAVVTYESGRPDPPPEAFGIVNGRWTLRRKATAVVLAGGLSSRMGKDKALLPVAGRPLIEHVVMQLRPHFTQILVSANDPERFAFLGLEVVPDRHPDVGPMEAVASALERSQNEQNFVIACDVPHVPVSLLHRLLRLARRGADVVVPVTPEGHYEPLFAVYRRQIQPLLRHALDRGRRKIIAIYDECETLRVPMEESDELRNVNTQEEYQRLLEKIGDHR